MGTALGEALRQVPIFAALAPTHQAQVEGLVQRRRFRRGDIIFHRGDPGTMLYTITAGRVRIYSPSESGGEVVLTLLGAGEFFGELSLLDGQPRSASAQAVEDCEAVVLSRDDFLQFLSQHPEAAIALLAVLAKRLRRTDELVEDAAFLDVPGRLAKRLLELMETHGEPTLGGVLIRMRLTHAELAAMVGATRESVSKAMKRLSRAGLLATSGHRIVICAPDLLRRRVG